MFQKGMGVSSSTKASELRKKVHRPWSGLRSLGSREAKAPSVGSLVSVQPKSDLLCRRAVLSRSCQSVFLIPEEAGGFPPNEVV